MSIRSYTVGFILSLIITLAAPMLLWWHEASGHVFPTHEMLGVGFVVFAITQLIVQLVFFLHLGQESKPRWNSVVFALTVFMVASIVGGTLWIMHNLQHMQSPVDMFTQENIFPNL